MMIVDAVRLDGKEVRLYVDAENPSDAASLVRARIQGGSKMFDARSHELLAGELDAGAFRISGPVKWWQVPVGPSMDGEDFGFGQARRKAKSGGADIRSGGC